MKASLFQIKLNIILFYLQLRRHGSEHDAGQTDRRHLLLVRRLGHRPPRPRHRLQLLTHLPSESTGRQTESSKGNPLMTSQGVNFIKDIKTAFEPLFFCQKIANPNCNKIKAVQSTFV